MKLQQINLLQALELHKAEIQELLRQHDSYLYLVVYNQDNQHGENWFSPNDEANEINWIETDIAENELVNSHDENITDTDWMNVKSWYLELWENNPEGDDNLIKYWCGNI